MSDWSELEHLPPDVITQRSPRSVYAVRGDLAADFEAAGYGANSRAELPASDLAGRTPLSELVVGKQRFVVRRFSHGGLLRWLTGRRYLSPLRPFRELTLARRLAGMGILVPEVVAARATRSAATWELELVSRRIEGSLDLGTLLLRRARDAVTPRVAASCARALGELVARLHQLEFLHADLTPRNVLVEADSLEQGKPRLWLVDLDGSRFVPGLSAQARTENLARLWRHVARMESAQLVPDALRLCARFLAGYEPRRIPRHALFLAIAERHRRASGWHAAASALERGVGARRSQPRP
ncbi:MAG TPA: lipopolysaccharide kinase InaA family protein [Planctomycetota bacterium]|nr:lipopolysaccharide kinase InaA family protein [Planctomycetota bacterium]